MMNFLILRILFLWNLGKKGRIRKKNIKISPVNKRMNPQQCDPQKREAGLVKLPLSILLKERKNDTTRVF
jgi:hypothetical protein